MSMFQRADSAYNQSKQGHFKPKADTKHVVKASSKPSTMSKLTWSSKGFDDENGGDETDSDGFEDEAPRPRVALRESSSGSSGNKRSSSFNMIARTKAAKYEPEPQIKYNPEWEPNYNKQKRMVLSREQQKVLFAAESGKSLFFTGAAGTGKSVLLRSIIELMRSRFREEAVAVCATTGLAALNIGGGTVHKWAGIGLGLDPADKLVERIRRAPQKRNSWKRTRVLIVDEVSMLDGELFDKLNALAKAFGYDPRAPFGGIQLILTGDFYQLPPVPEKGKKALFCFDAKCWNQVVQEKFNLNTVFRQQGDQKLVNMLNALRTGDISQYVDDFKGLSRPIEWKNGLEPSRLFPLKHQVSSANFKRLNDLKGVQVVYKAVDAILDGTPQERSDPSKVLNGMFAEPSELVLKKETQVMHTKNSEELGLVNGTRGRVVGFATIDIYTKLYKRSATWPQVFEKYGKIFEEPTLLTPARFRNDPTIPGGDALTEFRKIHGQCLATFKSQQNVDANPLNMNVFWPIVEFGQTYHLVQPAERELTDEHGKKRGGRSQLPFIHSWAISIHKSQGQTLESVIVELGSSFEMGQVYVALSRAVSAESLQVLNFSPHLVRVSEDVRQFYNAF